MTDGEWWRKRGPWSGPTGAEGAPEPAGPTGAAGSGAPGESAGPAEPVESAESAEPADDSIYAPEPPERRDEEHRPPTLTGPSDGAGWEVFLLDFSDAPKPPPKPIPEQRTAEEDAPAAEAPQPAKSKRTSARTAEAGGSKAAAAEKTPKTPKAAKAAKAERPARPGLLTGRRPSPLLLLSCATLVGGAVTGLPLVMLAGWGLGYPSRQLTENTRKFAIFGIPLAVAGSTLLWFWGRADGRWGQALQPGQQPGHEAWAVAPEMLRLSAVLSALFLFALAMRRPKAEG